MVYHVPMEAITKEKALALMGAQTDAELARMLGVTRQAVNRFASEQPLSNGMQWQIRALIAEGRVKPA